ncbi:MAG: RHS repeat-associated core domain-containing protein [bacterium]|nr:RHS repeat-associated core domain-containing protein [bacterium]
MSVVGSDDQEFTIDYEYDLWGNIDSLQLPLWDDGCRGPDDWTDTLFTYDGSWLIDVARFRGTDIETIAQFAYHPSGRIATLGYGYPAFASLHESVEMGRPKQITLMQSTEGATLWDEGPYSYDGSGNIWRIGSKLYSYDGVNRLTAFYSAGLNQTRVYEYDRWGNIDSVTDEDGSGSTISTLDFTPDVATNRLESLQVDGGPEIDLDWERGNLTDLPAFADQRSKTFKYSGEDRLMTAIDDLDGVTSRYLYDTGGERVAVWKRDSSGSLIDARFFIRDEAARVVSEWFYAGDGSLFELDKDYFYGGGRTLAQYDRLAEPPKLNFFAADHLGSTRAVFIKEDSTHASVEEELNYYPFGAFLGQPDPDPDTTHLFTGHERDLGEGSSQLDYMHARYYSFNLGRFLSLDPVGGRAGTSQSWNRYAYVLNNPLAFLDIDGLEEFLAFGREFDLNLPVLLYVCWKEGGRFSHAAVSIGVNNGEAMGFHAAPGPGYELDVKKRILRDTIPQSIVNPANLNAPNIFSNLRQEQGGPVSDVSLYDVYGVELDVGGGVNALEAIVPAIVAISDANSEILYDARAPILDEEDRQKGTVDCTMVANAVLRSLGLPGIGGPTEYNKQILKAIKQGTAQQGTVPDPERER